MEAGRKLYNERDDLSYSQLFFHLWQNPFSSCEWISYVMPELAGIFCTPLDFFQLGFCNMLCCLKMKVITYHRHRNRFVYFNTVIHSSFVYRGHDILFFLSVLSYLTPWYPNSHLSVTFYQRRKDFSLPSAW